MPLFPLLSPPQELRLLDEYRKFREVQGVARGDMDYNINEYITYIAPILVFSELQIRRRLIRLKHKFLNIEKRRLRVGPHMYILRNEHDRAVYAESRRIWCLPSVPVPAVPTAIPPRPPTIEESIQSLLERPLDMEAVADIGIFFQGLLNTPINNLLKNQLVAKLTAYVQRLEAMRERAEFTRERLNQENNPEDNQENQENNQEDESSVSSISKNIIC